MNKKNPSPQLAPRCFGEIGKENKYKKSSTISPIQEYVQGIKWAWRSMQLCPQEAGNWSKRKWQLHWDLKELKFTRTAGKLSLREEGYSRQKSQHEQWHYGKKTSVLLRESGNLQEIQGYGELCRVRMNKRQRSLLLGLWPHTSALTVPAHTDCCSASSWYCSWYSSWVLCVVSGTHSAHVQNGLKDGDVHVTRHNHAPMTMVTVGSLPI